MGKLLITTLIAMASSFLYLESQAKPIEFSLACSWDLKKDQPEGAPTYKIVKKAYRKSGKWDYSLHLRVRALLPKAKAVDYDLEGISGDEDYTEYVVINPDKTTVITTVYVQQDLKWATLSGNDGTVSYHCEK